MWPDDNVDERAPLRPKREVQASGSSQTQQVRSSFHRRAHAHSTALHHGGCSLPKTFIFLFSCIYGVYYEGFVISHLLSVCLILMMH